MTDSHLERLESLLEEHQIKFIDFKVVDMKGKWRHITIPSKRFDKSLLDKGIGFAGAAYGYGGLEESDLVILPDLKTAKIEDNPDGKLLSLIGDIYELGDDGEFQPYSMDPRSTAKDAIKYLRKTGIADDCLLSPEYEYYLFDKISFDYTRNGCHYEIYSKEMGRGDSENEGQGFKIRKKDGYHAPRPNDSNMWLRNQIVSYLERESIPVKYHHHELGGAGESEIEVDFFDLLTAADNTLFIKHSVKNIANLNGKSATFMPKPLHDYPGNGMHIHQYLLKEGENIFSGNEYAGLSKTALWYIGGLFKHGRSLMALTNPTTNSYKRLVPNQAAPVHLVFSKANRTAAVRIPGYTKNSDETRLELRTVDATCNPYLAYAAILMAGISGIKNKIDPSSAGYGPFEKDFYDLSSQEKSEIESAPESLSKALEALESDHDYLLNGGVFSKKQIDNWLELKREEIEELAGKPHPHEHVMYYDC